MKKTVGIVYACSAAALWAVSGIAGQILFTKYGISANWLVSTRLVLSGCLLLSIGLKDRARLISPFREKKDFIQLLLFSFLGMFLVQFTYFKTIEQSNASFATIIQYTGPFFVLLYAAIAKRQFPSLKTCFWLLVTLLGVTTVASKGQIEQLATSQSALGWGLASAISLAFYSIQPRKLLQKYGSLPIVGWGMLIGGGLGNVVHPMWQIGSQLNVQVILYLLVVILFGTALAYLIFLTSLRYLSSTLATVLTAVEPLLAAFLSIIVFHDHFTVVELVGFMAVIGSIMCLQKKL
ncbi:EamA family transporter [Enterococcus casseliflavus]|uniref:DMT family transporter n=1 Tax=Enterococcus casseliflavus TaxID=37734 RepID=UPI001E4B34C9|nr:EamA family transporter [Enterococcus casseliflavus]MCD5191798.1 EamA family transporter [Enterococcus casseliflavus]